MADEFVIPRAERGAKELARYVAGAIIGLVVLLLLFGKRQELLAAWHQLGNADPAWVAAAVAAEALSLLTFGVLQHRALRLSGATVPLSALAALSLANEAIANTVPGEPVVSSAYRYRFYRRHGVGGASAGWTIFTVLIAQAIGMAMIVLLGVAVALAGSAGSRQAGIAVVGLVIVAAALAVLIRRDLVLRLAGSLTRAARAIPRRGSRGSSPSGQHRDPDSIGSRIESTLTQMREIPLTARSTAGIVAIAAAVWSADFACLLCGFLAIHTMIPWAGVLLAYGVAQVAGSVPVVPGGIGIIEGSLAVILIHYGASAGSALAVALVYRVVSFWLSIGVGWITVAAIALRQRASEVS